MGSPPALLRLAAGGRGRGLRLLLICLGGAIGTALRYGVTGLTTTWLGPAFPYGTLAVNLAGSFLIGAVQEIGATSLLLPTEVRLFVTVGVLGGFTTYSAFSYDAIRLAEEGAWLRALAYVAVTTGGCLAAGVLGVTAARALVGLRGG